MEEVFIVGMEEETGKDNKIVQEGTIQEVLIVVIEEEVTMVQEETV